MVERFFRLSIMDRYLGRSYLATTLFVTLVFVAIIGVMQIISELSFLNHSYHFSDAIKLVAATEIRYIYQLFPVISLIGCVLALGYLASGNELIVLRTSGVSIKAMMLSLSKTSLILLIFVTALGEGLGPELNFLAQQLKIERLNNGQALSTLRGTWVRHEKGYTHFSKALGRHDLMGVTHYGFDQNHELKESVYAGRAKLENGKWQLYQVAVSRLQADRVETKHYKKLVYDIGVSTRAMQLSRLRPDQQSLRELNNLIRYRAQHGMDTNDQLLNFWQRVVQPLETILLVCIAVPFMMGPLRTATMGLRLVAGIIAGFSFNTISQFLGPFVLMYSYPAWMAALLPSVLVILIGFRLLRRAGD